MGNFSATSDYGGLASTLDARIIEASDPVTMEQRFQALIDEVLGTPGPNYLDFYDLSLSGSGDGYPFVLQAIVTASVTPPASTFNRCFVYEAASEDMLAVAANAAFARAVAAGASEIKAIALSGAAKGHRWMGILLALA